MGLGLSNSVGSFGIGTRKNRSLKNSTITKFIAWYSPNEVTDTYYINHIGDQERETLTQSGITGIVHPGHAIQYTGSKSQYSSTAITPVNYRLVNNSISYCFWIKMGITLPTTTIPIFGSDPNTGSGRYYACIDNSGHMLLVVRDNTSTKTITGYPINDDMWHHVFIVMDKTGYMGLYIDNVQQLSLIDISGSTFGDINEGFRIGYSATQTHTIQIRDIRLFPFAITLRTDRDSIMVGNYYTGVVGWWMCEEDKADAVYTIKDSVGTLNFTNYNFDSTSLVEGNWISHFNKYGYANSLTGTDLCNGAGAFSNAALWTINASRYTISGGMLNWLATGDTAQNCVMVAAASLVTTKYYKISFNIVSGTARFRLINQAAAQVYPSGDYTVGVHTITFRPAIASTIIAIQSYSALGAYSLDDLTIVEYEEKFISPLLTSISPVNDVTDRTLVFKGQAKYNLIKVDGDTVKLPSYVKELFDACELISVNNWYDTDGVGNEIDVVNIAPYQTKRQYYKNGQLIIVKADQVLTDIEDQQIRSYLGLGALTKSYYPIPLSLGTTEGTTAQIYATIPAMLAETEFTQDTLFTPVKQELDPTGDYLSIEWADFFQTDVNTLIPLAAKYGFANTFYRQIKPASDNLYTTIYYNRPEIARMEQSGQREGNHGFGHIGQHISMPLYDGLNTPSNADFRVERANTTNEFGCIITDTVDESWGSSMRDGWLLLSAEIGATAWEDLTDAQCQSIRESLAIFTLPLDGQGEQLVLETLDILSARYCGTTGTSVYEGDYTSIRIPNTVNGLAPSESNRIVGGIFQGASTTCNHEVWERVLTIDEQYKREFEYLNIRQTAFGSPAGAAANMLYHGQEVLDIAYQDRDRTKLATGASKHTCSITGITRSWLQCLRSMGYKNSTLALGQGYLENNWDVSSASENLEAQRIHKKNGCKQLDEIGNGYTNAMRSWDPSIPQVDQETLLTAEDLIKDLYDYTFTEERYTGMGASGATPPYHQIINTLCKYNAWGITPDCGADSSTGTVAGRASMALVMEALYQFCKRSGKKVISFEEATELQTMPLPTNYNYFPNNTFKTTPKTITVSVNAPSYPDGWNGGIIIDGELSFTSGTYFTRQYAIKSGTIFLSILAKGIGTILIKKIINDDIYDNISGALFTVVQTLDINSVEYSTVNSSFNIPALIVETYLTPTTPQETTYQEYMRGYGKNWCGIQIEVVVTGENTLTIKEPEILIN